MSSRRAVRPDVPAEQEPGDASPADDPAIHAHLRTVILGGRLPPGTKLGEDLLAQAFGISRARVRAVLQRLVADQLVELVRNRGAFIRAPGPKEARDVFEARRVIERVTTEIAARTILTWHLRDLQGHLDRQDRALMAGNRQAAILAAGEFHRRLAALAHNQALTTALEPLILRTSLIVACYGSPGVLLRAAGHHRDILGLIAQGQSLAAAAAVERCLYAIERELELTTASRQQSDLRRALDLVG